MQGWAKSAAENITRNLDECVALRATTTACLTASAAAFRFASSAGNNLFAFFKSRVRIRPSKNKHTGPMLCHVHAMPVRYQGDSS